MIVYVKSTLVTTQGTRSLSLRLRIVGVFSFSGETPPASRLCRRHTGGDPSVPLKSFQTPTTLCTFEIRLPTPEVRSFWEVFTLYRCRLLILPPVDLITEHFFVTILTNSYNGTTPPPNPSVLVWETVTILVTSSIREARTKDECLKLKTDN